MKLEGLYDHDYQCAKWVDRARFKPLRRWLGRRDVHHIDDATRLLAGIRGGALLDVGCGKGGLLKRWADRFDTAIGVDVSSVAVECAKKGLEEYEHVRVQVADIDGGLPFKDESFDVVACTQCLEHVIDVFGALREMNRVLRNGGSLVLSVPNIAYISYRWSLLCGVLPVTSAGDWATVGWDGGHLHYFTHRTLARALLDTGFRVVKTSGSGLLAGWRRWWASLLVGDIALRAEKTTTAAGDPAFAMGANVGVGCSKGRC